MLLLTDKLFQSIFFVTLSTWSPACQPRHESPKNILNTKAHMCSFSFGKYVLKCLDQEEKQKGMHIYQITSNTGPLKSQGRQMCLQTTYICTSHG